MVWTREQWPMADWLYRTGLIFKIDSDATSYQQGVGRKRISFNETLLTVKALSEWADNQTIVMHLVGWQGSGAQSSIASMLLLVLSLSLSLSLSLLMMPAIHCRFAGHDTLYPSLNAVNPVLGTAAELRQLAEACTQYNTILSYHINTDEVGVSPSFSCDFQ